MLPEYFFFPPSFDGAKPAVPPNIILISNREEERWHRSCNVWFSEFQWRPYSFPWHSVEQVIHIRAEFPASGFIWTACAGQWRRLCLILSEVGSPEAPTVKTPHRCSSSRRSGCRSASSTLSNTHTHMMYGHTAHSCYNSPIHSSQKQHHSTLGRARGAPPPSSSALILYFFPFICSFL